MSTWDVIVIGGGPAGENAAQYAIQGSERTAVIVEAELLGGECSYWACMPEQGAAAPRRAARRRAGAPRRRRDAARARSTSRRCWRGATRKSATSTTPGRSSGHAASVSTSSAGAAGCPARRRSRSRAGRERRTSTGAAGRRHRHREHGHDPAGRGTADARPWTSRDVTNLHEVPQRVAVIGGGVVACESATWLRGPRRARGDGDRARTAAAGRARAVRRRDGGRALRAARRRRLLVDTELESVSRPDGRRHRRRPDPRRPGHDHAPAARRSRSTRSSSPPDGTPTTADIGLDRSAST